MAGTEESFGAKGGGGSGGSGGPAGGGRGPGGGGGGPGGRRWWRAGRRRWWWQAGWRWRRRTPLTFPIQAGRRCIATPRFSIDALPRRASVVAAVDHPTARHLLPPAQFALAG